MNTFDLGRILEEVHWEEYAEFDNPPHRIKSLRHRLRMRRIMNQALAKRDEPVQHTRMKLSPRKVLILLVLIFTAIVTAAAIVVWYGSIYGQKHSDNTELFAVVEGAPEVIEEVYELTWVPEGYELKKKVGSIGDERISWRYEKSNDSILLEQSTRGKYTFHIDSEKSNVQETEINGKRAVIVQSIQNEKKWVSVYYDVKDYIITVSSGFPTRYAIEMLKSAKIKN